MATIIEYINPLLQGESLSFEQAGQLLDVIFDGEVPEAQVAAFLTAMRIKGATSAELAGLAKSLRSHAVAVKVDVDNLIDTCGTGGGRVKTCNISTSAAIVAAGAGAYVAKHGNRGITSSCGSADVLAELGVNIQAGPEIISECIKEAHIGFMFAPCHHPAMKYVQPIRKALGFRTVFNILGPLANPASVKAQVMGVSDESLMLTIAEALKLLGTQYAMVVHSSGIDEITTAGPTKIAELKDGEITTSQFDPGQFGIEAVNLEELTITDAKESAAVLREILSGSGMGPRLDMIVLNAAAAIIVAGLAGDFESGIKKARLSISEGAALGCLEKLIEISNRE